MLVQLIPFAIILSLLVPAQSELISVVQVFRHGQRAPVSFYTNDPYSNESYWTASAGQLTKTGMKQHFALGQYTRQRYGDWVGSFSVDDFRAQTTDIDRTHMSAQCNIAGLFPPTENQIWNENIFWQPIPVHPTDTEVLSGSVSCTAYTEELARVLDEEPYYNDINERYAAVYEYLTLNSGDNVTILSGVGSIYDSLFIENEVKFELPSWTTSVFPEPLTTLEGYIFQSLAFNTKLRRLSTGVFFDTIIDHFDTMLNSTSTPKYQMYSAHDTNIAELLSALGAFKPHAPYFASTIYIELHESSGEPYINIYHKNKDFFEEINVEGCEFDCPLIKFKVLMEDIRLDADTWETECAQTTNYTVSATVKNLLAHQDPNGPGHKLKV